MSSPNTIDMGAKLEALRQENERLIAIIKAQQMAAGKGMCYA